MVQKYVSTTTLVRVYFTFFPYHSPNLTGIETYKSPTRTGKNHTIAIPQTNESHTIALIDPS